MRKASWRQEIDQREFEARTPVPHINIPEFVTSAFEGTNPGVNVGAARTQDDACEAINAALAQAGHALTPQTKGQIGFAVALYWNQRAAAHRGALTETQLRLAGPYRMFGSRTV